MTTSVSVTVASHMVDVITRDIVQGEEGHKVQETTTHLTHVGQVMQTYVTNSREVVIRESTIPAVHPEVTRG